MALKDEIAKELRRLEYLRALFNIVETSYQVAEYLDVNFPTIAISKIDAVALQERYGLLQDRYGIPTLVFDEVKSSGQIKVIFNVPSLNP